MDQGFNENVYLIDLSHVKTAADIVFDLSSVLDGEEARNKRICLKLGQIDLNQAQLLSIKSLINSINSTLSYVDTLSKQTESAALALGIIIAGGSSEKTETPEPEMTYKTIDEVIQSAEETIDVSEGYTQETFQEEIQEEFQEKAQEEVQEVPPEVQMEELQTEDEVTETYYEEGPYIPSTPREYEKLDIEPDMVEEVETETPEMQDFPPQETIADEEVQEELDAIFNSEMKLEGIFEAAVGDDENEVQESLYSTILEEKKEYTEEDFEIESFATKYIKQTIRSGQIINFEGNIVIIGDCHPGCEIIASGDITVWGVLGGIAHAGSNGNQKAKIRALKMNAIQLRIADCYARRPDSLNTIFVEKTNTFTPEEARIINNEIVIFKIND